MNRRQTRFSVSIEPTFSKTIARISSGRELRPFSRRKGRRMDGFIDDGRSYQLDPAASCADIITLTPTQVRCRSSYSCSPDSPRGSDNLDVINVPVLRLQKVPGRDSKPHTLPDE